MTSLRLGLLASLAAASLATLPAQAAPIITTLAQSSIGPASDADGPQVGGAINSQVTTTGASSLCAFVDRCAAGQLRIGHATAEQHETALGIFSALEADGSFFVGGQSANNSLLARTTWQESPPVSGPTSITLFIKPGELILSDFASIQFRHATQARYRIELSVNGNVVFFSEAILQGSLTAPPTLTETGTDLGGTVFFDADFPSNVFGYRFDSLFTTIDLGNLTTSDVVLYTMEVSVNGPGLETGARAQIGDPFDLSGGGSSIAFSVPEPSALLLAGLGLAGLARARRRSRAA